MKPLLTTHRSRLTLVLIICFAVGCGGKPLKFSADGKTQLDRLQEQISKKNHTASKQIDERIEELHDKNKISDEEYTALKKVSEQAAAGQWDRAAKYVKPLVDAQKAGKE